MGGSALKNCKTRRYNKDEYCALEEEVVGMLGLHLPYSFFSTIPAYRSKETFGDMDLLVSSERMSNAFVPLIQELFMPKELVVNGNVISFEYKEFQIDLIITKPENLKSSEYYFAYNDLGNLVGRIAHSMGLKLGHDGLSYNWRVDTYQFKNVVLLKDWKDILPVLGYSYERYKRGFDTLEDIFEFVVSSPFFSKDIYLLHNRNNVARTRDRKRKTYMEFLEWIEADGRAFPHKQHPRAEDKKDWLPMLFLVIPGFEDTYKQVQKEWNDAVEYKQRFNGELVREWTGLEGKDLGMFMKYLKEKYLDFDFKKFVLENNELIVKTVVQDYAVTFKETL